MPKQHLRNTSQRAKRRREHLEPHEVKAFKLDFLGGEHKTPQR
jgi:hypothetical protein